MKLSLSKPTGVLVVLVGVLAVVMVALALSSRHVSRVALQPGSNNSQSSTSGTSTTVQPATGRPVTSSAQVPPSRWWTSPAGGVGSNIDVERPEAGAAGLHPDRAVYCDVLRSSMQAKHNPLLAQGTSGTNLILTTRALLAELEALSTGSVHTAWEVLSPALIEALRATAAPTPPATNVVASIAEISDDAKSACGVDLASPAS